MPRPGITLKLATSLDGRIATASGESRWITSKEARDEVHRMRADADAVMIGAGTARADDPKLTSHAPPPPRRERFPPPVRQPLRIVLDTHLSLSLKSKLVTTVDEAQLLIIGAEGADPARVAALKAAGASVDLVPPSPGGVDIAVALDRLDGSGYDNVLVEGGGVLAASLIEQKLVDRLEWFRAPIVLGAEGRPSVGALALARLPEAPTWRRIALRELGPDLWESYERVS